MLTSVNFIKTQERKNMKKYLFSRYVIVFLFMTMQELHAMPAGRPVAEGKTTAPAKPAGKDAAIKKMNEKIIAENNAKKISDMNAQRKASNLPPLPEYYQGKNPTAKTAEASKQSDSLDFSGKPNTQTTQELDMSSLVQPENSVSAKKAKFTLPKLSSQQSESLPNSNINPLARPNRPLVKPAKPLRKDLAAKELLKKEDAILKETAPAKTPLSYTQQASNFAKSAASSISNATGHATQVTKYAASRASNNTLKALGDAKDFSMGFKQLDFSSFLSNSANYVASGAKSLGNSAVALGNSIVSSTSNAMSRAGQALSRTSKNNSATETAQKELQDAMSPSLTQAAGRGAQYLASSAASGARYLRDGAVVLGNSAATSASSAMSRAGQALSRTSKNNSATETSATPQSVETTTPTTNSSVELLS
jgi:hypothetical protein